MSFFRRLIIIPLIFICIITIFPIGIVHGWTAADTYVTNTLFASGLGLPQGIATDSDGYVYIAQNTGIKKYTANGSLVTTFGPNGVTDVAINTDGDLLLVDYNNDQIKKYDTSGNLLATYFSTGTGNNQLSFPWQIAIDSQGFVYVSDFDNNRIQKYNSDMTYVATITGNGGAFNQPEGVAVDGNDNVYVLDSGNNRLQKFTSAGTFVWSITGTNGAWNYPEFVRADSQGNVYVADSGNNRLQIFNTSSTFQQEIGSYGTALGQFDYPFGLMITTNGTLFVSDGSRVQQFYFDRTSPVVSITSLTGDTTSDTTPSVTGSITDSQTALTSIEYSLDSGSYTACVASDGAIDETSENFSCDVASALSAGSHTIQVRATDSKTNTDTGSDIDSYTFTVSASDSGSNNSNTNTGSTAQAYTAPTCTDAKPLYAPNLFRIDVKNTTATLYYTSVDQSSDYVIAYSLYPDYDQHSVMTKQEGLSGVLTYTINGLTPMSPYYFHVMSKHGCMPSEWSNHMKIVTKSNKSNRLQTFSKN